jgi:hypothetical protein
MKKVLLLFYFILLANHSTAQTFIGLSGHNNQYTFSSKQYYGGFNNGKSNKWNVSLLFKQQLFKYLDICVEPGYERAKIDYDVYYESIKDNLTTEPVNLIVPVYLQPKFRFKNLGIHLNAGIAPQYILSQKSVLAKYPNVKAGLSTQFDDRYNYSVILGGGLDYFIKNKWVVSLNYFNSRQQKELKPLVTEVGWSPFNSFPLVYKNDRISLSLAYNLGKKKSD